MCIGEEEFRGALYRIGVGANGVSLLTMYRADLIRFNRALNLYSRKGPPGLLEALLLECVAAAIRLPLEGRVLDLGSGGGFPGIPVAILRPDLDVDLLERRAGRCDFLRREVGALGVPRVRVLEGEARVLAARERGAFAWVLLKAVAEPLVALDLARPFLEPGGRAALFRGVEVGFVTAATDRGWRHEGSTRLGRVSGAATEAVVHIFSR